MEKNPLWVNLTEVFADNNKILMNILEKDEYKNNFPEINLEINRMLLEFITWITPELDKNEYITICW